MSPLDATYCSSFFFNLHELNTPRFSTLDFVDEVIRTVTPLLYCSTDYESSFIGFLLGDIIATLNMWGYAGSVQLYKDKVTAKTLRAINELKLSARNKDLAHFEKYAKKHNHGLSAVFLRKEAALAGTDLSAEPDGDGAMDVDSEVKAGAAEEEGDIATNSAKKKSKRKKGPAQITHDDFKTIYLDWHYRISKVILSAIRTEKGQSEEYMYKRCALVLLSKLDPSFPSLATCPDPKPAVVVAHEKKEHLVESIDRKPDGKSVAEVTGENATDDAMNICADPAGDALEEKETKKEESGENAGMRSDNVGLGLGLG